MADFKAGETLSTMGFKHITIVKKIGEGGQGAVYEVEYFRGGGYTTTSPSSGTPGRWSIPARSMKT